MERLRKQGEEYQKKQAEANKGERYVTANGIVVTCLLCKAQYFHEGKALLNTRGMTFFGLDWLDAGAIVLVCTACGYIHWFDREVKPV